ncbi:MAG: T9SS type A sorting domain-containing protein [Gemmatimonadetes bacterium]|nr:T9SS type A sorting domain-containing protein [Gemmatimonadota bacterium]
MWDGTPSQVEALFKQRTDTTYPLLLEGSGVGRTFGYAQDNYAVIDHQGVLRYRSSGRLGNRLEESAIRAAIEESLTELAAEREEAEAAAREEAEAAAREEEEAAAREEEEQEEEVPPNATGIWEEAGLPARFFLGANFPNPFNSGTNVRFGLMEGGMASLKVYDSGGREVCELLSRPLRAGEQTVRWDSRDRYGRPVASGVYLLRLKTHEGIRTHKLLLIR